MTITLTLHQAVTLFGGFFALIVATGQLSVKGKQANNYVLSLMLLCFSYTSMLKGFAVPHGGTTLNHLMRISNITTYFCVGPLFMMFFSVLTESRFIHSTRQKLLFLPVPLSFAVMFPAVFVFSAPELPSPPLISLVSHVCVLWTMSFTAVVLVRTIRILESMKPEKRKPVSISLLFIFFALLLYAVDPIDRYMNIRTKEQLVSFSTVLIVGFFILSNRYSFYLQVFREEVKRIKYENSCTRGLNVKDIVHRLTLLMETEKKYRNEDLSLKTLAGELSITPHQLSEILNAQCKKNFSDYINQYRITEVQARLIEEPELPILTLAFDAGYDSSSTFYSAFKKITGQTPTVFKKKHVR